MKLITVKLPLRDWQRILEWIGNQIVCEGPDADLYDNIARQVKK